MLAVVEKDGFGRIRYTFEQMETRNWQTVANRITIQKWNVRGKVQWAVHWRAFGKQSSVLMAAIRIHWVICFCILDLMGVILTPRAGHLLSM
jgi:hypothetical protein